jgi:N-acetyltransferase
MGIFGTLKIGVSCYLNGINQMIIMNFSFDADIVLENGRSLLRPLIAADGKGLMAAAASDEFLLRYSTGSINTPALLEQHIQTSLTEKEQGIRYPFLIIEKKSGNYAGCTSFMNVQNQDERLEIGSTWLGLPYQRTGLNRSNKFLMLEYAFEELGFERVEFKADERNQPSRTAMEALGAQYEGCLRHYKINYDGFRRNTVYYSILKKEWTESVRNRLLSQL